MAKLVEYDAKNRLTSCIWSIRVGVSVGVLVFLSFRISFNVCTSVAVFSGSESLLKSNTVVSDERRCTVIEFSLLLLCNLRAIFGPLDRKQGRSKSDNRV